MKQGSSGGPVLDRHRDCKFLSLDGKEIVAAFHSRECEEWFSHA